MKFCASCGHPVMLEIPEGDHLFRHVCSVCRTIHYENPRIIAGCVPMWEDQILICRRAIEPRRGYWTLPAGFMENGETVQAGAARETREEALADVEIGSLLAVINIIHNHQVHLMFRARLRNLNVGAGLESLEVKLVREHEIPWNELAFESIHFSLVRFLEDRAAARELLHMHTIA